MGTPADPPVLRPLVDRVIRFTGVLLALLLVQNVIGTALNLYITIPTSPTFQQVFLSIPALTLHIVNGFAVVAFAAVVLVLVRRTRLPGSTAWAVLTLVGTVFALQEGFSFTFTQSNVFSYGMEIGSVAAIAGVAGLLFRLTAARARLSTSEPAVAVRSELGGSD